MSDASVGGVPRFQLSNKPDGSWRTLRIDDPEASLNSVVGCL